MTMTTTRRMTMLGAAVLAATGVLPGAARAAVVSYSAAINSQPDGPPGENTIPGFDASLGTATSVSFRLQGTITGGNTGELFGSIPAIITVSPYFIISSIVGGVPGAFNLPPSVDVPLMVQGTTGRISFSIPVDEVSGPEDPTLFLAGTASFGLNTGYNIDPNPFGTFDNGAFLTGTLTTSYDYVPFAQNVPEPMSAALLGLALAGVAAVRRRE